MEALVRTDRVATTKGTTEAEDRMTICSIINSSTTPRAATNSSMGPTARSRAHPG